MPSNQTADADGVAGVDAAVERLRRSNADGPMASVVECDEKRLRSYLAAQARAAERAERALNLCIDSTGDIAADCQRLADAHWDLAHHAAEAERENTDLRARLAEAERERDELRRFRDEQGRRIRATPPSRTFTADDADYLRVLASHGSCVVQGAWLRAMACRVEATLAEKAEAERRAAAAVEDVEFAANSNVQVYPAAALGWTHANPDLTYLCCVRYVVEGQRQEHRYWGESPSDAIRNARTKSEDRAAAPTGGEGQMECPDCEGACLVDGRDLCAHCGATGKVPTPPRAGEPEVSK